MMVIKTASNPEKLPLSLLGKTEWPWTKQSHLPSDKMSDGSRQPRITVVTPSYNQSQFIEEAIRSVLLQGYPNLEYIVIDGGSTDGSIEVIRKYEQYLAYWVSEKDQGQSSAINKGFAHSTGDILCWINSDDMLKPNALKVVAQSLKNRLEPAWLVGACEFISSEGSHIVNKYPGDITFESTLVWTKNSFPQPAVFWNRAMWEATGGRLDENLHYAMDFNLWLSMAKVAKPSITQEVLGVNRCQKDSKTSTKDVELWKELLSSIENCTNSDKDLASLKYLATNGVIETAITSGSRFAYEQKNRTLKCLLFALKLQPTSIFNVNTLGLIARLSLGRQAIALLKDYIKLFRAKFLV